MSVADKLATKATCNKARLRFILSGLGSKGLDHNAASANGADKINKIHHNKVA